MTQEKDVVFTTEWLRFRNLYISGLIFLKSPMMWRVKHKMVTNKIVNFSIVALILLSLVPVAVLADPVVGLDISYLKIDGEEHPTYDDASNDVLEVRRGQTLPIRLKVKALEDVEDVQVTAGIYGYRYSQYEQEKVFDTSKTFNLEKDRTRTVDLELQIPVKMESNDAKLRIFVADRNSLSYTFEYDLDVQGVERENAVDIKEAYLSPSNEVLPGRALSALVKIENVGDDDLNDGVTLVVSVPELNIKDTETLDQLDADEDETFEKIILRFPSDTTPGKYEVDYTVKFDEFETVTQSDFVTVLEAEDAKTQNEQRTVLTVPDAQNVVKGASGAVYPIMISNMGSNAQSYTITVSGLESWGAARVDPSATVIVPAENSGTVFLYVNANDNAAPGEKFFKVTIAGADESKEIPLTAYVQEGDNKGASDWSGVKKALEIGLIILVIILIIIGLIVGFNKLRGSDDDDDDDAKTYY